MLELTQLLFGPASGLQVCAHGLLHGKLKWSAPLTSNQSSQKELQPLTHALYVQTPHGDSAVVATADSWEVVDATVVVTIVGVTVGGKGTAVRLPPPHTQHMSDARKSRSS